MDTERLRELARYAQQATPGPWETVQYAGIHQPGDNRDNPPIAATYTHNRDADEAYIAAASPDVILALLDRLREPPTTLVIPDSEAEVLPERQENQDRIDGLIAERDAISEDEQAAVERIAELPELLRKAVFVLVDSEQFDLAYTKEAWRLARAVADRAQSLLGGGEGHD